MRHWMRRACANILLYFLVVPSSWVLWVIVHDPAHVGGWRGIIGIYAFSEPSWPPVIILVPALYAVARACRGASAYRRRVTLTAAGGTILALCAVLAFGPEVDAVAIFGLGGAVLGHVFRLPHTPGLA
ncbi:MAG: hypothetical protein ABJE47_21235 [bacterium]